MLHARAEASASGLIRRLALPPAEAPLLRWRWKVAGTHAGADETRRSGDDYAARVYVAFAYDPARADPATRLRYSLARRLRGQYPPLAAINYVWANRLPAGAAVPNPYAGRRVMMLALRSGDAEAGRWVAEERDVLADYRRLFGEEPPPYSGVAVMTDADDTGGRAEAWYAGLGLHAAAAPAR